MLLSLTSKIIFVAIHLWLIGCVAGGNAARVFLSELRAVLEPFLSVSLTALVVGLVDVLPVELLDGVGVLPNYRCSGFAFKA